MRRGNTVAVLMVVAGMVGVVVAADGAPAKLPGSDIIPDKE